MIVTPVERLHTETFPSGKKILFCVLNWGLGHATRSIPVIEALLQRNNRIILASDGLPLEILKIHFPSLPCEVLPAYNIGYPRKSIFQNMVLQSFRIRRAIFKEEKVVSRLYGEHGFDYIISDNRPGCHHPQCVSVLITHQIEPYHPVYGVRQLFKWVSRYYFRPFRNIWVPDDNRVRLSGKLSHFSFNRPEVTFIGLCSRMIGIDQERDSSIVVILSGPEPQRSLLEEKLISLLKEIKDTPVVWVRGSRELPPIEPTPEGWEIWEVADTRQINEWLNRCALFIGRSGYTSLMDLLVCKTKALLIPTPGQSEQEYLAALHENRWHWVSQDEIGVSHIKNALEG